MSGKLITGHEAEMAAIEHDDAAFRALPARERLLRLIEVLQGVHAGTGPIALDSEVGQTMAAMFGEESRRDVPAASDDEVNQRVRHCLRGCGF